MVDEYKSQNNNTMKNDIDNHRNIKLSIMPPITEEAQNADLFLIKADKGRISQVFSNLFSNALKFTKENDIIYVNLEQKNIDSRKNFIVSIKDTGSGIDPEIFPRLFTKFATKSEKGVGLGLFICKNIVELMAAKYGLRIMPIVEEDLHLHLTYLRQFKKIISMKVWLSKLLVSL